MKILAIEREASGTANVEANSLLEAEARKVWDLQVAGVVREIYFRSDRREAVLMLECSGVDEANTILSALPLVHEGLISFEVIPLSPYTGLSRLFAGDLARSGRTHS